MKYFKKSLFLLLITTFTFAQNNIIPTPVSYEHSDAMFMLDQQTSIDDRTNSEEAKSYIQVFKDFLAQGGLKIQSQKVDQPDNLHKSIRIELINQPELAKEGYTLEVKENLIELKANEANGVFNGLQTIRQLLPRDFENSQNGYMGIGMIMGCKITDYPRFGWRGLMLDVSRHFFTVEEVKTYIDKMAQYKFNVLHWHLTDDEGWRIEIKSLPKLTEVGAWRVERHGRFGDTRPYPEEGEEATYGGFYTQEQIKDIIAYAAERNITVIPEIDMPGHSMAALAAYPELSVNKEPKFVNPGSKFAEWPGDGSFKMLIENTLNPTDEKVYEFVDKVMTEVAELFPANYIHMGGDEAYHGYWEENEQVQKFMKKNKIKNTHELQSYFVSRVQKIINAKGKKMIGWDEILEGGLDGDAAVMSWRSVDGGIEAAHKGHEVVMTPKNWVYLDYTQGDHSVENPIYSDLSLEHSYDFEPVPDGVDAELVLGGQGNLWTEVIPTLSYAMYMTYPRALALSEVFWSPKEKKDWNSFINRTEHHFQRFDASNTNISKAVYEPIIHLKNEDGKLICELENNVPNTVVYYSIDNTYPVHFSHKYEDPFVIPEGNLSLRTQTYRNGRPLGRELRIHRDELVKRLK
ncbi:beta-N-acetylhexosaminidase [Jiulongibacter sp. NS-SX5]|uniref:beta-N-acetylhexosaminidase n=1 Tax=Jiulongibacter sp. NS-SX5 TaxID=3463854 RepID=UPI00405886CD